VTGTLFSTRPVAARSAATIAGVAELTDALRGWPDSPGVHVDHQVGSAGDRRRLGMREPDFERFLEQVRGEDVHQSFTVAKTLIIAGTSSPSG
jgi:hypothetical protein